MLRLGLPRGHSRGAGAQRCAPNEEPQSSLSTVLGVDEAEEDDDEEEEDDDEDEPSAAGTSSVGVLPTKFSLSCSDPGWTEARAAGRTEGLMCCRRVRSRIPMTALAACVCASAFMDISAKPLLREELRTGSTDS